MVQNSTGNTMNITVPKAFDGVVDVSCSISKKELEKFGVYDLLTNQDKEELEDTLTKGQHWMLSSRSPVRIVHAVRRPMTKPLILLLTAERPELTAYEVIFGGELDVHLDSTDRTVLSAVWEDPYDSSLLPEPGVQPGAKVLGTVVGNEVAFTTPFSDTKRHDLEVTAEAFSKFSSYFTQDKGITFNTNTKTVDARGLVDSSVVLSDPTTGNVVCAECRLHARTRGRNRHEAGHRCHYFRFHRERALHSPTDEPVQYRGQSG